MGWDGAGETFRPFPWREHERERHNKPKSAKGQKKINTQLLKTETKKRQRLKALGIDYSFPGYAASAQKHKSHVADEGDSEEGESEEKEDETEDKSKPGVKKGGKK